jgi:hypothetical protein
MSTIEKNLINAHGIKSAFTLKTKKKRKPSHQYPHEEPQVPPGPE